VRRLLICGSPFQGRCPASEVNDGGCPEKPDHLTGEDQELSYACLEAFPSEGAYLEVVTCFPLLSGPNPFASHKQFTQGMDNGGNCGFKRIWGEAKTIGEAPDP